MLKVIVFSVYLYDHTDCVHSFVPMHIYVYMYMYLQIYIIYTLLLMHLDLANLACTFVFRTASFHVTHLHEVVRAHPLHALVTRPKTPPLFC